MQAIPFHKHLADHSMIPGLKLACFWYAGLSLGLAAARFYGDTMVSLLRLAPAVSGSMMGAFWISLLPLLLSACAVFLFRRAGCYAACLLRGFGLGYVMACIRRCYPGAGLLMSLLLTFSALWGSVILFWYHLRRITLRDADFLRDTAAAAAALCAVAAVDHWFITPFLVDVINL